MSSGKTLNLHCLVWMLGGGQGGREVHIGSRTSVGLSMYMSVFFSIFERCSKDRKTKGTFIAVIAMTHVCVFMGSM